MTSLPLRYSMDDPYDIAISDRQSRFRLPVAELQRGVAEVFRGEGIAAAEISLAVVDNPTIHQLNRQFLDHDYPTDVITFPLSETSDPLEGEIVISSEYAEAEARLHGWPPERELLLYAVHGALHLCGYDDRDEASQAKMRQMERHYLERLGVEVGQAIARPAPPESSGQAAGHSAGEVP